MNEEHEAEARAAEKRGEFSSVSPPVNVAPFGDWDYFYIKDGAARWFPNPGQTYQRVEVPIGFVSDLASVPSILWFKYPAQGRYAIAAIIHDYLYWVQTRPRSEADDIFYTAMQDSEVDALTRNAFWAAVRAMGLPVWSENARRRAAGEKRLLQKFPPDLLVRWTDWSKQPGVFAD